jgi:hypothetical protein
MSIKELDRLEVVNKYTDKELSQKMELSRGHYLKLKSCDCDIL